MRLTRRGTSLAPSRANGRTRVISYFQFERAEFRGTDRYELRGVLGAGAMGVVYEAFDRELHARVALKCLPSTSPRALSRFKQEFRSLHSIHHANLVHLGELVYERGQLFFTMELVDGFDIVAYCRGDSSAPSGRRSVETAGPSDATLDGEPPAAALESFVHRQGPSGPPDEVRVRSAFAQLVRGLMALHSASKVHRDVKPSNVLVTQTGRAVLLDFGVVTDFFPGDSTPEGGLFGTVGYMAPEQAARRRVGPEADWYSLGTMLFEVCTRRLPFEGRASELLARKQQEAAPRIRDLVDDVPPAFDVLCALLLERRPEARPSGAQILSVLEADGRGVSESVPGTYGASFVGRERELSSLREGLETAREGRLCAVHVEGQSGNGKTALLRHFVERVRAERAVLVLSGRCSEREDVPYKALDGVMDDLADFVVASELPGIQATLERRRTDLLRAFPVFGKSSDAPVPPSRASAAGDPYVWRLKLFRALRELLAAVLETVEVIVVLDDMQWADADSLALLSALLQPPDAPAVLFVVASRPDWAGAGVLETPGAQQLTLGNLTPLESTDLANQLLVRSGYAGGRLGDLGERIAAEAAGHPLFIDELVRECAREGGALPAPVLLETALRARVERLNPRGRALVRLTAVAGGSLPIRVLSEAANQVSQGAPAELLSDLLALCDERFLRLDGTRGLNRVEPYHERVGAAVRASLGARERSEIHRALAVALENDVADDPEALAVHWQAAGETVRAARHALTAASRAADVLAFERAARLYKMALECDPGQVTAAETREKLADALASAGLGPSAAAAYLAASVGAEQERRLELERRAADQLFRSGHIDDAEPLIQRVLKHAGIRAPRSPFWSLVALLLTRLRLALTRFDVSLVPAASADARELVQLNACWSVAVGLSMVSNIRGACVQSRHMELALRVRQPFPLLRAVAAEACYVAVLGKRTRRRVAKLLRRADELALQAQDPYSTGFTALSKTICSFLMGHWARSRGYADAAERVFEQRPAGAMWELASARTFGLWSSFYLGDIGAMQARASGFVHEAEARGDRYAATLHRTGLVVVAWLASDDATTARQQVLAAEAGWSRDTFDFQRYLNTLGHCLVDLYDGSAERAHERLVGIWPDLARSFQLRIQNVRIEAWYLRGVAAVGAARAGSARERLGEAERCTRKLDAEHLAWASALSRLISAGVASARGDAEAALRHWRTAEVLARGQDMGLFAELAAFRRGSELGGEQGRQILSDVHAAFAIQRVRKVERLAALFAPAR